MIDVVLALVTARLSLMVSREPLPFRIMAHIRQVVGVVPDVDMSLQPNEVAKLLSCVWCSSVWIGCIIALTASRPWYYGLAYSMVAVMVYERWIE